MNGGFLFSQKALVAALTLLAVSLAGPARGQVEGQQKPGETGEPRWKTGLHVQGLSFDNFFQLSDAEPQEDVEGLRAAGRLTWRRPPDSLRRRRRLDGGARGGRNPERLRSVLSPGGHER